MTIFILALHGVATGGPEATHQLSDALLAQGFDARMVYYRWDDLSQGLPAEFPEYAGFAPEYERYQVKLARSLPDEEGSVIVLPETAAMLAPAFRKAKVLIWWLSVDNAFGALSALNLNWLRRANVFHASQSRYAADFCQALQLNHIGMLSDYTVDLSEYSEPLPMERRPKIVAFNARPDKVIADLDAIGEAIFALDPEIRLVAINGLARHEVAAVFAMARVYVDLGNFPGKDRLPREAASMGCDVACLTVGAGFEIEQAFPLESTDPCYLARTLAQYGALPRKSDEVIDLHERDTFNTEVRDVFSQLV